MREAFRNHGTVRNQLPLILATDGEPEPDIVVVRGNTRDYTEAHPTQEDVLLIAEVSDTTLRFDSGRKLAYYAEAMIAEYWIVDLNNRQVIVCRAPHTNAVNEWGFSYQSQVAVDENSTISPLANPGVQIIVRELLPTVNPSTD